MGEGVERPPAARYIFLNVEAAEPDFHARFDAVGKTYKYYLYNRETRDPFKRHYYAHVSRNLDIGRMRSAARFVEGTHDFTSFCSAKTEMANKVRTISRLDIEERHEEIIFTFTGNGFLYNMVRIIVGTLLEVGAGKRAPEEMKDILAAKDRRLAGKTAPPKDSICGKSITENGHVDNNNLPRCTNCS